MTGDIEVSLGQIVAFFRRGVVISVLLALLLGAAAYYVTDRQPPVYRASATAYAAERGLDLGSFGLPQLTSSTLHVDTYRAAILSDPLLEQALTIMGNESVEPADIRRLRGDLAVRTEELPRLITVESDAGSAAEAARIANAVIEALVLWDSGRAGGNLDRLVTTLEQQVAALETQIARLAGDPSSAAAIQRNARTSLLTQQQDRLNLALALQVSVAGLVEVVQPAALPTSPFRPTPHFNTILAALVGAILGYAIVFLRGALDTNVRDPEELVEISGLPVLATFPKKRGRNRSSLREAASFLRANLLYLTRNDSPPIVLVTSPTADQGKTTVAASLAESLARNGHRTLLVDGDLRNPSIAKYFQMRGFNHLTVVDALNRNENMRSPSTIEVGGEMNLNVLPGGRAMPQAAEYLGSSFEHAVDRWRAGYQAIVIDSPPALAVADGLIMARHCTGVLVVVNAESSDRKKVRQTIDLLSRSENRLLGIVATHVDRRAVVSYGYTEHRVSPLKERRTIKQAGEPGEPVT